MTDRLSKLRVVDPVLTKLATGYKNAAFVGDVLFPVAMVDKEAGKIPLFGKEAFRLHKTERAIRADSNVMIPDDASLMTFALTEHDIAYPVDLREKHESMFDEERKASLRAVTAVELGREAKAAGIAQLPATYDADAHLHVVDADRWTKDSGEVLDIVETAKEKVRDKIGLRPNTMIMGPSVWKVLKYNDSLVKILSAGERKVITPPMLSDLFGVKWIVIGEAVAAVDGKTGDLWGNNIVMAYVAQNDDGADYETPSFGYTLRRNGMPQVDTYDTVGGKVRHARYTDIYQHAVVGKDAGYLITNCVAP